VQAYYLKRDEIDNSLFFLCGDVNNPSLAVVTYLGEEVKGSESLIVHPLAVIEEKEVPHLVSSD
jgi:hypothetical protein